MNEDAKLFIIFLSLYLCGILCGIAIEKINQKFK
jgi:hypothetical protein